MIRKLILGTASVLVLGIGGAALDFSADADDVPNAVGNMSLPPGSLDYRLNAANLSKDDIRWAQIELHNLGLYNGSLDGVIGPETERALLGFQKSNGLEESALASRLGENSCPSQSKNQRLYRLVSCGH
jgi:peptidoglycan hydrolase-like protein with peptidoglycan-binding domain